MKATDLMIGDWVLQCELNVPVKVQSIMRHYADEDVYFYHEAREYISNISKLEPIALTEEIMEKNGFEKYGGGGYIIKELDDDEMPTLYIWNGNGSMCVVDEYSTNKYTYIKECKYVHEFQHELKSCGIEKDIML